MIKNYFIIFFFNFLIKSLDYSKNGTDFIGTCSTGLNQSPIDLSSSVEVCNTNLFIDIKLFNKNINISSVLSETGVIKFNVDKDLFLLYFRNAAGIINEFNPYEIQIHIPSEHQINSVNKSLELQIYCRNVENNNEVKAVSFLYSNSANSGDQFITFLTNKISNNNANNNFLSQNAFALNKPIVFLNYLGSKTIPNCDENIEWFIIESTTNVLDSDITKLKEYLKRTSSVEFNNRSIKDLNSRLLNRGGVNCNDQFINFISFIIWYAFIYYFIFKLL